MIKAKEKKCGGTTPETKNFGCGVVTFHRVYGLCKSKCYPQWLMNTEAGKLKMQKAILKASKPRLELERAKDEHKKQKATKSLLVNVRNELHTYVKKRDKGLPCISCGCSYHSRFQAGHFYKAELYSNMKFDPNNIHGQCPQCNMYRDGNEQGYRQGLIVRHGKDFVNKLDLKAKNYKSMAWKWSKDYLINVRNKVKKLNKSLRE
jgi:hypothetical protein